MSPLSRSESGEGDEQRNNNLFLTRTSRVWVAAAVASLVLLIPLYLTGYGFDHGLLFSGPGIVAGIFGVFFTLYVLDAYVIAPVLQYFP